MDIKTTLNRCHPVRSFVYGDARFVGEEIHVTVQPRKGSRGVCGECGRRLGTDAAKQVYKDRAATAECANERPLRPVPRADFRRIPQRRDCPGLLRCDHSTRLGVTVGINPTSR